MFLISFIVPISLATLSVIAIVHLLFFTENAFSFTNRRIPTTSLKQKQRKPEPPTHPLSAAPKKSTESELPEVGGISQLSLYTNRLLAEPLLFDYDIFLEEKVPSDKRLEMLFPGDAVKKTQYRDVATETALDTMYGRRAWDMEHYAREDGDMGKVNFYKGIKIQLRIDGGSLHCLTDVERRYRVWAVEISSLRPRWRERYASKQVDDSAASGQGMVVRRGLAEEWSLGLQRDTGHIIGSTDEIEVAAYVTRTLHGKI